MTPPPDVIVVGAGALAELRAAGITDVTVVSGADSTDIVDSVFDDDTDTWVLHTSSGETVRATVVIRADQPHRPWIPELPGRNDFRGPTFHAARWDSAFDPAGKHVAVIGTDSAAGHHLPGIAERAASVSVFGHPPRRFVPAVSFWTSRATRWMRRRRAGTEGPESQRPTTVGQAIEALTASGIRTRDGREHRADAIIYGTGFAAPDSRILGAGGLTIQQAWPDGMEPFAGVAVHGFPNYFFVSGPDTGAQARYIAECVGLMTATASGRIEVRRSSQQVFNERAHLNPAEPIPAAAAFDLSGIPATDTELKEIYDGAATLTIGDASHPVRVRLTGRIDPIDGHYHWQGTVFSPLVDPVSGKPDDALKQARAATLTVGNRSAPARIVEQTPWGTHSIAGVGAPPYPLNGP